MERAPNNASTQFTLQRLLVSMVAFSIACAWTRAFITAMQDSEPSMFLYSPIGICAVTGLGVGMLAGRPLLWTILGATIGGLGLWGCIYLYIRFIPVL